MRKKQHPRTYATWLEEVDLEPSTGWPRLLRDVTFFTAPSASKAAEKAALVVPILKHPNWVDVSVSLVSADRTSTASTWSARPVRKYTVSFDRSVKKVERR